MNIKDYNLTAVIVSVDYTDLLKLTLPINRHHFEQVVIITSRKDYFNLREFALEQDAYLFVTDAFYDNGAIFNKWKALEQCIDVYNGFMNQWLCLLDADIVWPKIIPDVDLQTNNLYSPLRRMMVPVPTPLTTIPDENTWSELYGIHRNIAEWAGYTQIFHTSDYHLGERPWHEVNWKHAGGADSFFQFKWSSIHKYRLPFEVLHIGEAGKNWCGRATQYLDGSMPEYSEEKIRELRGMIAKRTRGEDRYRHEKLS